MVLFLCVLSLKIRTLETVSRPVYLVSHLSDFVYSLLSLADPSKNTVMPF